MDLKFEFPASSTSSGGATSGGGESTDRGKEPLKPAPPSSTPLLPVVPGARSSSATGPSHRRPAVLLLQQAFAQFVSLSEAKISNFLFKDLDKDLDLYALYQESLIGDTAFESILKILASLASSHPKLVIDSIMVWRKSKNEAGLSMAESDTYLMDPMKRRELIEKYPSLKGKDLENSLRERRSILSNLILCQVFTVILEKMPKNAFPDDLGAKMEEMVFGQLNHADPDVISRHVNRMSNVEAFAKLSGALSISRFPTLSDRFMTEIKKLGTSKEAKLEFMIRCMRFLSIKIYPMDELEESADFLRVCGDFFQDTHSVRIKNAFASTFVDILEPVAAVAAAEVNLPMWMKTIEIIYPKAMRMFLKPKHFQTSIPLITTLLCVSKKDFFLKNWVLFTDQVIQKFKERDKVIRHLAITSVVRLVWVYLFRCPDSLPAVMQKRLDFIFKQLTGRRGMLPSDTDPDLHVRILYYILNKFPEFGSELIVSSLLGVNPSTAVQPFIPASPGTFTSLHIDEDPVFGSPQVLYGLQAPQIISSSLSIASNASVGESTYPFEKYVVALRAFKYHFAEVQSLQSSANSSQSNNYARGGSFSGNSGGFGTSYIVVESKMTLSTPPFPTCVDTTTYKLCDMVTAQMTQSERSIPTVVTQESYGKLSSSVRSILDKVNEIMGSLGPILESSFSKTSLVDLFSGSQYVAPTTPNGISSRRSSFSDTSGSMYLTGSTVDLKQPLERPMLFEMLRSWMDLIPIASPSGMSPASVISLLSKHIFSGYDKIRLSALNALKRIASIRTERNDFWKLEHGEWSMFVLDIMMQTAFAFFTDGLHEILASASTLTLNSEKFLVDAHNDILDVCVQNYIDKSESDWKSLIERTEGYALIFLSSHSPEVRKGGFDLLLKVTYLHEKRNTGQRLRPVKGPAVVNIQIGPTLKRPLKNSEALEPRNSRILRVFKLCGLDLVKRNYHDPSLANSARMNYLNKDLDEKDKAYKNSLINDPDPLSRVMGSPSAKDDQIWRRCFPDLVRGFCEYAPTGSLSYSISQILMRINVLSPIIQSGADASVRLNTSGTVKWNTPDKIAIDKRLPLGITEELIQQWSLYLCFSAAVSGVITQPELALQYPSRFQTNAVKNLFTNMFDLLSSERTLIRQGVVTAFGCIQPCNYGILLEAIQPYLSSSIEDMKMRMTQTKDLKKGVNSGFVASQKKFERQRMELVHVISFIADFVDYDEYRSNLELTTSITTYLKQLVRFLGNHDVQNEWDNQMVRYYFCGLVGRFYSHLVKAAPISSSRQYVEDVMPFELRMSLYQLFQTWCGYGQLAHNTREREARMMHQVLDHVRDIKERGHLTAMMEDQRKALEIASLKAMSSLCYGPLAHATTTTIRFNLHTILKWIDSIFLSRDLKIHAFAQLALEYMLSSNSDDTELWDLTLKRCYAEKSDSPVAIGIFLVLVDIFCRNRTHPCSITKLCILALYKIGDLNPIVRKAAARLVIFVDAQLSGTYVPNVESAIPGFLEDVEGHHVTEEAQVAPVPEEFEKIISEFITPESSLIGSNVVAVYKDIQFGISDRWSRQRGELTLAVMIEMLYRLDMLPPDSPGIRDILLFLAPWITNINLVQFQNSYNESQRKILSKSSLPATAPEVKLCLMNLFYLTIRFGVDVVNELEEIWVQMLTSQDANGDGLDANVKIVLEYLIGVSIRKRNPKGVIYSKNIVVYLARTEAGALVISELMEKVTPDLAVPYDADVLENSDLADIARTLPMDPVGTVLMDMPSRHPFSPSQLSILFLADCILQVPPGLILPHLPLLLHSAMVHLDHPSPFVVEECHSLLNNLKQALVPGDMTGLFTQLDESEQKLVYEDLAPPKIELLSFKTLQTLISRILQVFSRVMPDLRDIWGNVSVKWGIECPVRHIACRSLQVNRCLSPRVFDKRNLSNLLTRCGATLGDTVPEVQGYALDCLLTLQNCSRHAFPLRDYLELWWAGVACLYSPHKWEYEQGLDLLLDMSNRLDLSDQKVTDSIMICKPVTWRGKGVLDMLLRGLSFVGLDVKCLAILNLLVTLPHRVDLLDGPPRRLLFGLCANLPDMMASFEVPPALQGKKAGAIYQIAKDLHILSSSIGLEPLSHLLSSFSKQKFRSRDDFIGQTLGLVKESYPGETEAILEFFLQLLSARNDKEMIQTDGRGSQRGREDEDKESEEEAFKARERILQILLFMMRVYEPAVLCSLGSHRPSAELWSPLYLLLGQQSKVSDSLLALLDLVISCGPHKTDQTDLEIVFGERQFVSLSGDFYPSGVASKDLTNQVRFNISCTSKVCQARYSLPEPEIQGNRKEIKTSTSSQSADPSPLRQSTIPFPVESLNERSPSLLSPQDSVSAE